MKRIFDFEFWVRFWFWVLFWFEGKVKPKPKTRIWEKSGDKSGDKIETKGMIYKIHKQFMNGYEKEYKKINKKRIPTLYTNVS